MDPKIPKNPPTVKKLEQEVVPIARLGQSTLTMSIPAEHLRIHRAVMAKAAQPSSR